MRRLARRPPLRSRSSATRSPASFSASRLAGVDHLGCPAPQEPASYSSSNSARACSPLARASSMISSGGRPPRPPIAHVSAGWPTWPDVRVAFTTVGDGSDGCHRHDRHRLRLLTAKMPAFAPIPPAVRHGPIRLHSSNSGRRRVIGFGFELVGVAFDRTSIRRRGGGPFTGDTDGGADALGQWRVEPGLPGSFCTLAVVRWPAQCGEFCCGSGEALVCTVSCCSRATRGCAIGQFRRAGSPGRRRPACRDGGRPGIRLGASGHLGLPAERPSCRNRRRGRSVAPGWPASRRACGRPFLRLRVLEDAGSLLGVEGALILGRIPGCRELPLPHDHVHFATDTGIAEQRPERPSGGTSCR